MMVRPTVDWQRFPTKSITSQRHFVFYSLYMKVEIFWLCLSEWKPQMAKEGPSHGPFTNSPHILICERVWTNHRKTESRREAVSRKKWSQSFFSLFIHNDESTYRMCMRCDHQNMNYFFAFVESGKPCRLAEPKLNRSVFSVQGCFFPVSRSRVLLYRDWQGCYSLLILPFTVVRTRC